MKIVYIINRFLPHIGGAELYVYNLSKILVRRGHRVAVITTNSLKFRGMERSKLRKEEVIEGIKIIRANAHFNAPGIVFSPNISLITLKHDADLFNIHGFLSNISVEVAMLIKSLKNKPVVLTVHDLTVAEHLRWLYALWKFYINYIGRLLLRIVNAIIVQNPLDRDLIRSLGIPGYKIHVIPNGIDTRLFDKANVSKSKEIEFRRRYGIEDKKVLLFVGRLEARKRIDLLLKALKLITDEIGRKVVLLVVGPDNGEYAKLVKLQKLLGLEDCVVFTGSLPLDDLLTAYTVADVFVSLSAQEAFGISIIEAMAMERPVVTHRLKGISYAVKDGVNGICVDPFDYKKLARKVIMLLQDGQYRISLGKKARTYVLNNFTVEKMVDKTLALYEHLIRG